MCHTRVSREQSSQFGGRVAFVPAGQMQVVRVERGQLRVTVGKRIRTVRRGGVQIRPKPIEHGHEVIANALHPEFSEIADGLGVIFDQAVARGSPKFDVLMHRNAFDDLHLQLLPVAQRLQAGNSVRVPDLSDRNVVDRRHHTRHAGNLPDVRQRDAVPLAVPAECHFHKVFPPIPRNSLTFS